MKSFKDINHSGILFQPGKSAHDAIDINRKRCWQHDWVLEFDVRRLFDNIDHELLMKAVRKHTDCKWELLYIERWLTVPFQKSDGSIMERNMGTPQGGVISPVLSLPGSRLPKLIIARSITMKILYLMT